MKGKVCKNLVVSLLALFIFGAVVGCESKPELAEMEDSKKGVAIREIEYMTNSDGTFCVGKDTYKYKLILEETVSEKDMKVGFVVLSNDNSIDFYDIFYHDSIIGSGYKYYPEKTLKVVSEYYYVDSMDDN